jgi:hypothetical protein
MEWRLYSLQSHIYKDEVRDRLHNPQANWKFSIVPIPELKLNNLSEYKSK